MRSAKLHLFPVGCCCCCCFCFFDVVTDLSWLCASQEQMQSEEEEEEEAEESGPPLVFFDLETTGLSRDSEIVQLAAVCSSHSLNLYVLPQGRMDWGASRVTGLSVHKQTLLLHHRPLLCTPPAQALLAFLCFLHMCQTPAQRPLLVAHNARASTCPCCCVRWRSTVCGGRWRTLWAELWTV
ncbi:hypothetical protein WMY93_003355 [Mugilogobius chulae]|uniref:exodeoxyribonuclease III n=1 Tax=Mugilogobius chulae TaxID=88201 RepID=A0AAW0PZ38_9GOBI